MEESDYTKNSIQEKSVLRWGGLAGIAGDIAFIVVFIVVGIFVGADPANLEGWVTRFPDIRAARTVENGLYLLVLILWVPHYLAVYYTLRKTNLAPALFGSALSIMGMAVLAAGALPHVATDRLADIYFGPGVTAADQAALVLMWQSAWGIFDALLFAGLGIAAVGITMLGVAMLRSVDFGSGFGWLSTAIGVIGIAATVGALIDPDSPIVVLNVFGLIIFHLIMGWKIYRLSNTV